MVKVANPQLIWLQNHFPPPLPRSTLRIGEYRGLVPSLVSPCLQSEARASSSLCLCLAETQKTNAFSTLPTVHLAKQNLSQIHVPRERRNYKRCLGECYPAGPGQKATEPGGRVVRKPYHFHRVFKDVENSYELPEGSAGSAAVSGIYILGKIDS